MTAHLSEDGAVASGLPTRPIQRAFEQVADQLRSSIISGEIAPDARLPNEAVLAQHFGVGRSTVREALRLLAAQNLIRTGKGAAGGSYVTLPTVDRITEFVETSLHLLTETRDVSVSEFLEARELLEVPLAGLAAVRRDEQDIAKLNATVPDDLSGLSIQEQSACNKGFHVLMMESCGNSLLKIAAHPVLITFQRTKVPREHLSESFLRDMNDQHRSIIEAIEKGDARAAEAEMRSHLEFLRPWYQKAWPFAVPISTDPERGPSVS